MGDTGECLDLLSELGVKKKRHQRRLSSAFGELVMLDNDFSALANFLRSLKLDNTFARFMQAGQSIAMHRHLGIKGLCANSWESLRCCMGMHGDANSRFVMSVIRQGSTTQKI